MGGFNGLGQYLRYFNWTQDAANGIDITASRFDTEDNGYAAGLSNCVTRDGQGVPTADISWGGHKLTNLANPVGLTDAVNLQSLGSAIYPQTAAEVSTSITPTSYLYPPGDLRRYGADPLGASDSAPALLQALTCNNDVYDAYPGGGIYLFNSETVLPSYPARIRGQTRWVGSGTHNNGTQFILGTAAGTGASTLRTTSFTTALLIENIAFRYQTYTTGQISLRFAGDLRDSIVRGCSFMGNAAAGTTVIGIQFDSGGTFSGGTILADNRFSALAKGIWLQGSCTTIKIRENEFYGYVGGVASGSAIECDYPVTEPVIAFNYFEGWATGIYSNGAGYLKQAFNDYAANTVNFNWVRTTFAKTYNQSIGETLVSGGAPTFAFNDNDTNSMIGPATLIMDSTTAQLDRGYAQQRRFTSPGVPFRDGVYTSPTFSAGNFTANGAMTWTVTGQTTYTLVIVGNKATLHYKIVNSTIGGTLNTALQIAIPSVFGAVPTPAAEVDEPCRVQNNGTWGVGVCKVLAAAAVIQIFVDQTEAATWAASTVNASVSGSITFPINGSS